MFVPLRQRYRCPPTASNRTIRVKSSATIVLYPAITMVVQDRPRSMILTSAYHLITQGSTIIGCVRDDTFVGY